MNFFTQFGYINFLEGRETITVQLMFRNKRLFPNFQEKKVISRSRLSNQITRKKQK